MEIKYVVCVQVPRAAVHLIDIGNWVSTIEFGLGDIEHFPILFK